MNKNQIKGTSKKLAGQTKEVVGEAVGNKKMERQGKTKASAGKVQKAVGDVQAGIKSRTS